jgi:hypothetical protein
LIVSHTLASNTKNKARRQTDGTRADEVPGLSIPKVVKDTVPMGLEHAGMDVETRVPELGNLFGQKLNARG